MIKGAQKQMIVVRTGDSRYFDEAYFVLRRDIRAGKKDREDLLREADRILSERRFGDGGNRHWKRMAVGLFAVGILLGAAVSVLFCRFLFGF